MRLAALALGLALSHPGVASRVAPPTAPSRC